MNKTKVSIIIPVLNEEKNLINLFESIRCQELPSGITIADIIVVDNGSIDNSVSISKKYCTNVFVLPDATIADLRNYGAAHSIGEILVFIDADCVLGEMVISNVIELLFDKRTAAVGPDGLIPNGDVTWIQNVWHFQNTAIDGNDTNVDVENLSSGFFAIKTDLFNEVGGFNGSLTIGEDSNISNKLRVKNYRLIKSKKILVYNSGYPRNIIQFIKREYWHGDSIRHLIIHKNIDKLTIYLIVNLILWGTLIYSIFIIKSAIILVINIMLLVILPLYKAVTKVKKTNKLTIQLLYVYIVYVTTRSLALFKLR